MKRTFLLFILGAPLWAQQVKMSTQQFQDVLRQAYICGRIDGSEYVLDTTNELNGRKTDAQAKAALEALRKEANCKAVTDIFAKSETNKRADLRLSQAILLASTMVDVLSSRGMVETNPILGRGEFHLHNQGAKAFAITGALILAEALLVRKVPASAKLLRWINFGGAAAHGMAATHNWRQQ